MRLCCAAYLVQGLKAQLASLAEQYYLKDLLFFDPAKVRPRCGAHAAFRRGAQGLGCAASAALCTRGPCAPQAETWRVIAGLPWVIKPIYGFITDTVPVFGMRRRPYLVGCGLVGAPLPPSAPT